MGVTSEGECELVGKMDPINVAGRELMDKEWIFVQIPREDLERTGIGVEGTYVC